jgi:hypothetical protein
LLHAQVSFLKTHLATSNQTARMAGGSFTRVQNKAKVFFTITLKKKLNPRTQQGKSRLASLLLGFLVLCVLVPKISGGGDALDVSARANHPYSLASANSVTAAFGADEGSEGSDEGFSFLDDEGDEGNDDDDDEGGGANIDGSNAKSKRTSGGSRGNDDDDDEEDDDDDDISSEGNVGGGLRGGGANEGNLASLQRRLLKEDGPELLKFFGKFQSEEAIHAHMDRLMKSYVHLGKFVKKRAIGTTAEKRPIVAYSIGRGQVQRDVLVVGLEHASEWGVPMSLVYFTTRMVQLFEIKPQVTEVLKVRRDRQ